MFSTFHAPTADSLWQTVHDALCFGPDVTTQVGRGGKTREILHACLSVADPRQRWIASREPALNPAFALAEVVWILQGRRDAAFLNFFNHQLCRFAGNDQTYHGAYGYRLAHHFGVNQLERAYMALRSCKDSRQIVLQMWDASADLPRIDGTPASPDIPCNISSLLKLRSGRLEWLQVMRSNDVFRGLPHNLVQFTTLQEVMAGWLGVELGSYNHISDSLHIYADDCENSVSSNIEIALNEDSCALSKEESDLVWGRLERAIEQIIDRDVGTAELLTQIETFDLPSAFQNMLCVLSAEGIRRRGDMLLAAAAMERCSNPLFAQLWGRWIRRLQGASQASLRLADKTA